MRTALIGAQGQLGGALLEILAGEVVPLGRAEVDVADAESVTAALDAARPDRVINAAAYNQVDRAEDEPQTAYAVNALGPRNLAAYCGARDLPLLHVSTDYVFGLGGERDAAWRESDAPGPLGAYAVSKLAGEYFVRSLCRRHFVVRTCGLYGRHGAHGNFVETMLRLGRERPQLRVVDDQRCTPTSCSDLAAALADLLATEAYGIYHATNSGETTWCGFAREIFRVASIDVAVEPITTAEFGARAPRPKYSVLDCIALAELRGRPLPAWHDALGRYLGGR